LDEDDDDDDERDDGGGGPPPDLLKSYVAFMKRSVRKRRLVAACIFVVCATLTIAATALWPRTYHSEMVLFAQHTDALATRGDNGQGAMWGAAETILRHDNVAAIIKQTDLIRLYEQRRPPLGKLRDAISEKLHGGKKPRPEDLADMLIGMVQNQLKVEGSDSTLTLSIDWPDAQTTALLLEAAEENFLEARHVQEISLLMEYISILEGHAAKLRTEVETMAAQLQDLKDKQRDEAKKKLKALGGGEDAVAAAAPTIRHFTPAPSTKGEQDDDLARLKSLLENKQHEITELEDYRSHHLLELQNSLAELQTTYTDAHPKVIDTKANILSLSHESQQVTNLRADVKDLTAQIKMRTASAAALTGGGTGFSAGGGEAGASAGPLPQDIMGLMQDSADNLDPAVRAQFSYALDKYTALRSQISSARIDLDTAQAAFNHRYKVVAPPEVPNKPTKPKVPLVAGAGFILSLLLSMLIPIIAELRTGKIVERWQVHSLGLPILGELQFPPSSSDTDSS
jgi:uncharacterized protein involved in exopolysaccharide biosynthesis